MEFGKPESLEGIDWRLPKDDPRSHWRSGEKWGSSSQRPLGDGRASSGQRLAGDGRASSGQYPSGDGRPSLFFGGPVWSCKEWVGKIFPPKTSAKDFLYHYSRYFNAIELNTTFYRIPTSAMIANWISQTPRDFLFCPKVPQVITHSKDIGRSVERWAEFVEVMRELKERLGVIFFQMPPYFKPSDLPRLKTILTGVSFSGELAVEFRHPEFFEDQKLIEPAFELLSSLGVAAVTTDVGGRRDVLHVSLTKPHLVLRFVGNELHPSDFSRIKDWVKRLQTWHEGLERAYFFLHHPTYENVPELAEALCSQINNKLFTLNRSGRFDPPQGTLL